MKGGGVFVAALFELPDIDGKKILEAYRYIKRTQVPNGHMLHCRFKQPENLKCPLPNSPTFSITLAKNTRYVHCHVYFTFA